MGTCGVGRFSRRRMGIQILGRPFGRWARPGFRVTSQFLLLVLDLKARLGQKPRSAPCQLTPTESPRRSHLPGICGSSRFGRKRLSTQTTQEKVSQHTRGKVVSATRPKNTRKTPTARTNKTLLPGHPNRRNPNRRNPNPGCSRVSVGANQVPRTAWRGTRMTQEVCSPWRGAGRGWWCTRRNKRKQSPSYGPSTRRPRK